MQCDAIRDELLDVLYDEADAECRRRVEIHLEQCPGCREELAELRGVRQDLAAWRLPEASRRPQPRSAGLAPSAWRLAAAAALLLALGGALGLAGFQAEYARGPLRVSLGRSEPDELRRLLAEQEQRHQAELAELRAAVQRSGAPRPALDEERLLGQMAQMVEQSEARQAARWEASWNDWGAEAEDRRRYDLARVSAGLSYLDQKAGAQAARTSELMGFLLQASDRR